MKENVLDVLMYLFENYINEEVAIDTDQESLRLELKEAGFRTTEITKAIDWLGALASQQKSPSNHLPLNKRSLRIYSQQEVKKLDVDCQGFLLFLEQTGILDQEARELVIDRVMALETEEIDLDQLKWVILMVLFNQPGGEAAFAWMEDLVFEETMGTLH